MKRQRGYINFDFTGMLIGVAVLTAVVAAPVGWLAIEGLIWVWNHVSISVK